MIKKLIVIPERCSGCQGCMVICSLTHFGLCQPSKSIVKVSKNPLSDKISIKIGEDCDLCLQCAQWCTLGVYKVEET